MTAVRILLWKLRMIQVCVRVIDAKPDAGIQTGIGQLLQRISVEWSMVDDIVIRIFRIEHGEAVMVPRNIHDILHPRVSRDIDPLLSIEIHRIELR